MKLIIALLYAVGVILLTWAGFRPARPTTWSRALVGAACLALGYTLSVIYAGFGGHG